MYIDMLGVGPSALASTVIAAAEVGRRGQFAYKHFLERTSGSLPCSEPSGVGAALAAEAPREAQNAGQRKQGMPVTCTRLQRLLAPLVGILP